MGSASSFTWFEVVVLSMDGTIGVTPTEKFWSVSEKDDAWEQVVPGAEGLIHMNDPLL